MLDHQARKRSGAYYTPPEIVDTLVRWAAREPTDRMLDPACGDGRFLAAHARSVGIEQDARSAATARERVPGAIVHTEDFFAWANGAQERFECAAGNPPFIRYQQFNGDLRANALFFCRFQGADFSALTSSWAPFLVATASLLKPGGRMAFVVPAEIGHAPYAEPLVTYLIRNFAAVSVVAIREKVFRELSEDVWLLFADGFGGSADYVMVKHVERFACMEHPSEGGVRVSLKEWREWNSRLRPFLLPARVRHLYRSIAGDPRAARLGDVARVGIGYVTGANEFFHFRPSVASKAGIPRSLLLPAVRTGKVLTKRALTRADVDDWLRRDDPVLLLHLPHADPLPRPVSSYLDSDEGREARLTYKCRNRNPWYVVPDVFVPDAFLSYMSGEGPALVANQAGCVCANAVHAVSLRGRMSISELQRGWKDSFTRLSCEIEGHALGGGVLKLEPREAASVILAPHRPVSDQDESCIAEGIAEMRRWRHYV